MKLNKKIFLFGASITSGIFLSFITFLMLTNNITPVVTNNIIVEHKTWKPITLPWLGWATISDNNQSVVVGWYVENLSAYHGMNLTNETTDTGGYQGTLRTPVYWYNGSQTSGEVANSMPAYSGYGPYSGTLVGFSCLVRWTTTHAWNTATKAWDLSLVTGWINITGSGTPNPAATGVQCTEIQPTYGSTGIGGTVGARNYYLYVFYVWNNTGTGYQIAQGQQNGAVSFNFDYLG